MVAIEDAAYISIGRACGFAGLAIFCVMLGLAFEPFMATRAGDWLSLATTLVLAFYAARARTRPYKKTEAWLILPKAERPPAGIAQRVMGETLREAYFWHARQAALVSAVLLGTSAVLQATGWTWPSSVLS
jgi:hypothetical protein